MPKGDSSGDVINKKRFVSLKLVGLENLSGDVIDKGHSSKFRAIK